MIRTVEFTVSTTKRSVTIPRGPWLAVGIGRGSEHGHLIADGQPLGIRSPAIFDQDERQITVEAVSYFPGVAQVVAVTCEGELAALCQPRPPHRMYVARGLAGLPDWLELRLPFDGRNAIAAAATIDGDTAAIYTEHGMYGADGVRCLGSLNNYPVADTAAATPAALAGGHETERCDELVVRLEAATAGGDARLWAVAFDWGT